MSGVCRVTRKLPNHIAQSTSSRLRGIRSSIPAPNLGLPHANPLFFTNIDLVGLTTLTQSLCRPWHPRDCWDSLFTTSSVFVHFYTSRPPATPRSATAPPDQTIRSVITVWFLVRIVHAVFSAVGCVSSPAKTCIETRQRAFESAYRLRWDKFQLAESTLGCMLGYNPEVFRARQRHEDPYPRLLKFTFIVIAKR